MYKKIKNSMDKGEVSGKNQGKCEDVPSSPHFSKLWLDD